MSGRPPVVYNKSIPFKWKARGHGGKVGAMCARTMPGIGTNGTAGAHVFTGGADGIIRVWDQRGRIICETTNVSTAITCMRFSNENLYVGNASGEVLKCNNTGKPLLKWTAHKRKVTTLQVVSEGRVFTGSLDCQVKLFSRDADLLREFPVNPADSTEAVMALQVIKGNLLFVATEIGNIKVYNMRQELVRILKNSAIAGNPITNMQILTSGSSVTIFSSAGPTLHVWELTKTTDSFGESELNVDKVRSLERRTEGRQITSMHAMFANPLGTHQPSVYLGTSGGTIHLYIPTTKLELANHHGSLVEAQKFKSYVMKTGGGSPILCLGLGGGKLFVGTSSGEVACFKEPLNMLKLRTKLKGAGSYYPQSSRRHTVTVVRPGTTHVTTPAPRSNSNAESRAIEERAAKKNQQLLDDDLNTPSMASRPIGSLSAGGSGSYSSSGSSSQLPSSQQVAQDMQQRQSAQDQATMQAQIEAQKRQQYESMLMWQQMQQQQQMQMAMMQQQMQQQQQQSPGATMPPMHQMSFSQARDITSEQAGTSQGATAGSEVQLLQEMEAVSRRRILREQDLSQLQAQMDAQSETMTVDQFDQFEQQKYSIQAAMEEDQLELLRLEEALVNMRIQQGSGEPTAQPRGSDALPQYQSLSTPSAFVGQGGFMNMPSVPSDSLPTGQSDLYSSGGAGGGSPMQYGSMQMPMQMGSMQMGSMQMPMQPMGSMQMPMQMGSMQMPMQMGSMQMGSMQMPMQMPMQAMGSMQMPMMPPQASGADAAGDNRCVVCLDEEKNGVLYPCGHNCICQRCGKELIARKSPCPLCRSDIKDCIKVFR